MPVRRAARTIRLLIPAAVLGLTALMPGLSSASTYPAHFSRNCSSIGDPYVARQPVLRQCGFEFIPRRAARALPGGGHAYVYRVGGIKEEVIVPPRGFNPLSAPAARLREYGIPTAKQVGSRSRWAEIMRAARFAPPPRQLIAGGPVNPGGEFSNNPWAGYVATGNSEFDFAQASYTEPYIGSSQSRCSNLAVGSWVGIGGFTGSTLAQEGTSFGDNGQPNLHNEFQELVIDAQGDFAPVWYGKVDFNDSIYAKVAWNSSTSRYNYFVSDSNNGHTMDVTAFASHYDGNSAEVITEAPGNHDLANFGKITFTGSKIGTTGSSATSLGSWPPTNLPMTDGSGNTMAFADPIYGSGEDFSNNDR